MRLDQATLKGDGQRMLEAEDGKGQILDRTELLRQLKGENSKD